MAKATEIVLCEKRAIGTYPANLLAALSNVNLYQLLEFQLCFRMDLQHSFQKRKKEKQKAE